MFAWNLITGCSPDEEFRAADQQTVFAEQVKRVYPIGEGGAYAVIVVAWLYVILVWSTVPRNALLLWAVVMTLVSVVHLAHVRQHYVIESRAPEWARGLIVLAGITGFW